LPIHTPLLATLPEMKNALAFGEGTVALELAESWLQLSNLFVDDLDKIISFLISILRKTLIFLYPVLKSRCALKA